MKSNFNRNAYRFKNKLSLYFTQYKFSILICSLLALLGCSLGIYTAIKYSGEIELSNLADSNLVDFLKGDKGTMGLFFPYLFSFSLYCCVIIFLNFKPVLSVFTYFALIVRGYLIGFDITVLIVLYGFAGIINVVFIILPCDLMVLCSLIIIAAIALKRNRNIKNFGPSCNCNSNSINFKKAYCFFIVIGILILLLKCLLLPLIRVTIIVK